MQGKKNPGSGWTEIETGEIGSKSALSSVENLVPAFCLALFGSIRQEPDHGVQGSRCVPLPHHIHPLRESPQAPKP